MKRWKFKRKFQFFVIIFLSLLLFIDSYITEHVSFQLIETNNVIYGTFPLIHKPPSTHYTNEWYKQNYSYLFTERDYSKCPPCYFPSRSTPTSSSTPNDLILVYSVGGTKNLILFIRTLRHVHCKATVVFLIDSDGYKTISKETLEVLHDCGMNIIDIGEFKHDYILFKWSFGYICMYDFLYLNQQYINRVLVCDLFDIVFQGDPFIKNRYLNTLKFVSENALFTPKNDNTYWVILNLGTFPPEWNNTKIVNSGQVLGTVYEMTQFLDVYLSMFDPMDFNTINTTDQGYFNIILKTGKLKQRRISYEIEETEMFSRVIVVQPLDYTEYQFGNVKKYKSNEYAPVVHQYYANYPLSYSLLDVCPRKTKKWTNYSRLVLDVDIDKYYASKHKN